MFKLRGPVSYLTCPVPQVIDEADKLLAQSFQDWLAQVLSATRPALPMECTRSVDDRRREELPTPDALAPAFLHLLRDIPHVHTALDEKKDTSCQKLLFSATLTRDPSKIAALNLRDPKYFIVQSQANTSIDNEDRIMNVAMERFTMPATLKVGAIATATGTVSNASNDRNIWSFAKLPINQ